MKKYAEVEKTRKLAATIVDSVFYPEGVKSHSEFANRFNQVGDIARLIDKHNSKK